MDGPQNIRLRQSYDDPYKGHREERKVCPQIKQIYTDKKFWTKDSKGNEGKAYSILILTYRVIRPDQTPILSKTYKRTELDMGLEYCGALICKTFLPFITSGKYSFGGIQSLPLLIRANSKARASLASVISSHETASGVVHHKPVFSQMNEWMPLRICMASFFNPLIKKAEAIE